MRHGIQTEADTVQRAIAFFRSAASASAIAELEDEQRAAGSSGLEWYGRTARVFERWLASHSPTDETRRTLEDAIHAVRVIFGSAT
jgi:hypothetical protein